MTRNVTMDAWGFLQNSHYLIHDRDTKYTKSFQTILAPVRIPGRRSRKSGRNRIRTSSVLSGAHLPASGRRFAKRATENQCHNRDIGVPVWLFVSSHAYVLRIIADTLLPG